MFDCLSQFDFLQPPAGLFPQSSGSFHDNEQINFMNK